MSNPRAAHQLIDQALTAAPRALLLTADPRLADTIRALDPRVITSLLHRLPGAPPPRLPDTDGLLVLAGTEAHGAPDFAKQTYYVSSRLDDPHVWSRSLDFGCQRRLYFLPDDRHGLGEDLLRHLGPLPGSGGDRPRTTRPAPDPHASGPHPDHSLAHAPTPQGRAPSDGSVAPARAAHRR